MDVGIDGYMVNFVLLALIAILTSIILRIFKQPSVIGFIITGLLAGPHMLGIIEDKSLISLLGNIGVILLLFFIGMEISIANILRNWKIAVIGTFLQITISILCVGIFSYLTDWSIQRTVLFGFVISLSSTTVIIKLLEMKKAINTPLGRDILGILIVQDIAIVPMMIILASLKGDVQVHEITAQIIGAIIITVFLIWIIQDRNVSLPFRSKIQDDHELQVFAALVVCFGFAIMTGLFYLSSALGAFLAGIYISAARETRWVHESLSSFKTVFVAIFFMSIGLIIDPFFIRDNLATVGFLVFFVFFINTMINALIFKWLGAKWKYSFYAGALLSQIGEFSFLLAGVGFGMGIITDLGYQTTIAVISVSLLLSPFWIIIFSRFIEDFPSRLDYLMENSKAFIELSKEKIWDDISKIRSYEPDVIGNLDRMRKDAHYRLQKKLKKK